MKVSVVTTSDRSLLSSVRQTLSSAREAILCVAFVQARGVHLIENELRELHRRSGVRMVVTTAFDHEGGAGLAVAAGCGVVLRTLNPGAGSTYHPKVYLGRSGTSLNAVVGSANLTGGLATNVELAMCLAGNRDDELLASLWDWAERTWADPRAADWTERLAQGIDEDPLQLRDVIAKEAQRSPVFLTLGRKPAKNRVADVTSSGVYVETERSAGRGRAPELIPAWMFNVALDHLRTYGRITNRDLLNYLRVHRSSAVCAILSRLPGFEPLPERAVGVQIDRTRVPEIRRG